MKSLEAMAGRAEENHAPVKPRLFRRPEPSPSLDHSFPRLQVLITVGSINWFRFLYLMLHSKLPLAVSCGRTLQNGVLKSLRRPWALSNPIRQSLPCACSRSFSNSRVRWSQDRDQLLLDFKENCKSQ